MHSTSVLDALRGRLDGIKAARRYVENAIRQNHVWRSSDLARTVLSPLRWHRLWAAGQRAGAIRAVLECRDPVGAASDLATALSDAAWAQVGAEAVPLLEALLAPAAASRDR